MISFNESLINLKYLMVYDIITKLGVNLQIIFPRKVMAHEILIIL